jgi:hypothetical protein
MNCQEFEDIVSELARDEADTSVRQSAAAHAAACLPCAARLADQRVLGSSLRAFGEATKNEFAPPRLKRDLMAAFAARRASDSAPVQTATIVDLASFSSGGSQGGKQILRGWPPWMLAAAAAILILLTASVVIWRRSATIVSEEVAVLPTSSPSTAPVAPPVASGERRELAATREQKTRNKTGRVTKLNRSIDYSSAEDGESSESEIASEFIPITYAGDAGVLDKGFVVRVEVPREKLIAMGLPLNLERGKEAVKADVMMGDNGVVYAIRVVH